MCERRKIRVDVEIFDLLLDSRLIDFQQPESMINESRRQYIIALSRLER